MVEFFHLFVLPLVFCSQVYSKSIYKCTYKFLKLEQYRKLQDNF